MQKSLCIWQAILGITFDNQTLGLAPKARLDIVCTAILGKREISVAIMSFQCKWRILCQHTPWDRSVLTFPTEAPPASTPDLGAGTDEDRWVRNKGLAPEGPPGGAEGGAWGPRSKLRHPLLLLVSPPYAANWTYIHMVVSLKDSCILPGSKTYLVPN